jgi:hypothetical protein
MFTITACYHHTMIIDDVGIRAFDQHYQKIPFCVDKQGFDYIIYEGEDYFHYTWEQPIILHKINLHGSGIYHLKVNINNTCEMRQNQSTCHLYNLKPYQHLDVKINQGILIGCDQIKQLDLTTINSVVKHFCVSSLVSLYSQKSIIRININHFTTVNQSVDDDSNVIINPVMSKL